MTLGGDAPRRDAERIDADDAPSVGIVLGVFKAAQLLEMDDVGAAFDNFTAIDLETTDNDTTNGRDRRDRRGPRARRRDRRAVSTRS